MSLVQLPDRNGEFLASQKFLPVFAARNARIVQVTRENGSWEVEPWLELPYVHRFDILERNGSYYFLGCILSSTMNETVDWDAAGYLVASSLDTTFSPPEKLESIAEGMHHNHGYWKFQRYGYDCALTACDEGVFEVIPPKTAEADWKITKILDKPASDAVYIDVDGDGEDELAVIEPFHGTDFVVYHKENNKYVEMYRHSEEMDFLHAIWGGELQGEPVIILGYRALAKNLTILRWKDRSICSEVIEYGGGSSNLTVVSYNGTDRLVVANRESNQAAIFDVTGGE